MGRGRVQNAQEHHLTPSDGRDMIAGTCLTNQNFLDILPTVAQEGPTRRRVVGSGEKVREKKTGIGYFSASTGHFWRTWDAVTGQWAPKKLVSDGFWTSQAPRGDVETTYKENL